MSGWMNRYRQQAKPKENTEDVISGLRGNGFNRKPVERNEKPQLLKHKIPLRTQTSASKINNMISGANTFS